VRGTKGVTELFKQDQLKRVEGDKKRWMEDLSKSLSETPERLSPFTTFSGFEVKGVYTPEDTQEIDYSRDIGFHGPKFTFKKG
jgi:methylmalonyl-CoA mutase N-terminal domain/subunit